MNQNWTTVLRRLISPADGRPPLVGVDTAGQFQASPDQSAAKPRRLNAAFLLALTGDASARLFLEENRDDQDWGGLAAFYLAGLGRVKAELDRVAADDPDMADRLGRLAAALERDSAGQEEPAALLWPVFFPEGAACAGPLDQVLADLRRRRRVKITALNPKPITDPAREVLFTANALLTVPDQTCDWQALRPDLAARLTQVADEEQVYWYDHPVAAGAPPEKNEVLHGLSGLAQAAAFEKRRRPGLAKARLKCLLSVSVTHKGLMGLARDYLAEELGRLEGLDDIDVYVFTESETDRLTREVLLPAARSYFPQAEPGILEKIIGVDGEYGRHYSFLKAIAALWQVLIDPGLKATFKIDLDQVFPQPELVAQTGSSAFEHLMTPLWGARGLDWRGKEVEMGLLAGALVNSSDIEAGLFTPDVDLPTGPPRPDELVFFSSLPQAVSTRAEMLARYDSPDLDGQKACLQRVHVTGGTIGALIDSLRRHRPFTPTFIGRAEDQAYLLSVLFKEKPRLRYLHAPGLIMRHDKEAMAQEAIKAAQAGKLAGDYARMLYFSLYAQALPWSARSIKEATDPFTGCFVTALPASLTHLRLALKAADLFETGKPQAEAQAVELLRLASGRLESIFDFLETEPHALARRYQAEAAGWGLFYDLLDRLETGLAKGEDLARKLQSRARRLVEDCRIVVNEGA